MVCEHADEAEEIKQQLGKRSVACLLLNKPNKMLAMIVRVWTEGLLNAVLVLCDDMLSPLAECDGVKVDLLIHSTEPLPHVFQKRIQTLMQKKDSETQVMVIRSTTISDRLHIKTEAKIEEATPLDTQKSVVRQEIEMTSPQKATVKEIEKTSSQKSKDMTPAPKSPKLQITPMETDKNITSDDNSFAESSDSNGMELDPKLDPIKIATQHVYRYIKYGVYAQSQHEQESCFDIKNVKTLHPDIMAAMMTLKIGHKRAKCVQRFAWPHVAKGRSLYVVANQKSGKTWCYLPWLCHRFMTEAPVRDNDTNDYGPSCIILCSNAEKGKEIARWCGSLTSKSLGNMDRVIMLFERSDVYAVTAQLVRHPCGILLTTVELMLQLCDLNDKDTRIFNPLAIRCVAIDDLCNMWRCRRMDCEKLIQWLFSYLRIQMDRTQLLIVGRLWSDAIMHRLLPKLPDVLLLFDDALEATIYGDVKLDVLITDSDRCKQDIIQMLKTMKLNEERVVLACHSKNDADQLVLLLSAANIKSFIIYDNHGLQCYEQWFKQRKGSKVLITTDETIPKLRDQIDCLVHYTPARNWPSFKMRFNLFYFSYQTQRQTSKQSKSIVFLGNGDRELVQLWHICDFMLNHDRTVPENWITWLTQNRSASEPDRNRQLLCSKLSVYGECRRLTCRYRHNLWNNEIMYPLTYPKNYQIQFYILSVDSPSKLVVKMTKFKINTYFLGIPVTELGKEIQVYYQDPINRRQYLNPKPGAVCIVKLNNQYQRVLVRQVDSDGILVKQVDAGRDTVQVKPIDLWVCEEHFFKNNFEATELCITGLMPLNMDRIWPEDARNLVRKHFGRTRAEKPFRVYNADVDFDFNDVRFVKNVYDDEGNDIKSLVLNNMLVQIDDKVIMRLQELFKDTIKPISDCIC
ncbi:hypothetical protein ACLKA7_001653 [Drosophila subpalustris]